MPEREQHYLRDGALAKIILCGVFLAAARMTWADGGAIQFQGDAGPFCATIFTQPPILRAGLIDVTMLLQDRSHLNPLLDAKVTFDVTLQESSAGQTTPWMPPACAMNKAADLSDIPALLGHGENHLLYGSFVQIPRSGLWQLKAHIQRGAETAEIAALLRVAPPPPPLLAYWHLWLLLPTGILGFVLHQTARGRRRVSA
jgi:hypothetical protein